MPFAVDILNHPGLHDLRVLSGDPTAVQIESVGFVERSAVRANLAPKALAVLGYELSRNLASDHLVDVTLREWAAYNVSTLVFTDSDGFSLAATAHHLVKRMGLLILQVPPGRTVHEVLVAASDALSGDAAAALHRAWLAYDRTYGSSAHEAGLDGDLVVSDLSSGDLLWRVTKGLGIPISFEESNSDVPGVPVVVDGHLAGQVVAGAVTGHEAKAADIICALVASRLQQLLRSGAATGISRNVESVLSELLVANEQNATRLADDARKLGVGLNSWYRVTLAQPTKGMSHFDPEFFSTLGRVALRSIPHHDTWHLAHTERGAVLIEESKRGFSQSDLGTDTARRILTALDQGFPALEIVCGIGTPHQGLLGLRISVAEAGLAIGRAPRGRRLAAYDAARLQPVIIELANASAAGLAIRQMLSPFEQLDTERAMEAVHTLSTYLDEQGSVSRTADRLMVHRNTVAYRITQIKRLLDSDLEDADERLALQLACRSYSLWRSEDEWRRVDG